MVESVLPVLPLHSGDTGLPLFMGAGGLPPRLVEVHVNGIRWIPGVYGLVDATGVPEIVGEKIILQKTFSAFPFSAKRNPLVFFYASSPADYQVPRSSINFVRGPFGGDAIRAWVARRLSSRLSVHFTLDEANSSGQFPNLPYDGQKLTAELRYKLSGQAALRYFYFDSRNEAGAKAPFYPEEQFIGSQRPVSDSAGFGKEQRIFHGMEFSMPAFFVRPFYWELRNEFRSSALRVRHRTEQAGIEAGWQRGGERWNATVFADFRRDEVISTSVAVPRSQNYLARGELDWTPAKNLQTQIAAAIHKEASWPAAFDVDFNFGVRFRKNLQAEAALNRRIINPAPAEFANTLPVLQSNKNLQPGELQRATLGLGWKRSDQKFLQIEFSVNRLLEAFVLDTLASTGDGYLRNSRRQNAPGFDFMAHWQLSRKLNVGGHGSWLLKEPPNLFWYQHLRRGFARGFVEFFHDFFGGDLAASLRLVWRYYGESRAPIYTTTNLPSYVEIGGGALMDAQLSFRHGSGTVYFSYENIFDKRMQWRPGVQAPGVFLKWGVRVDFRN